MTEHPLPPFIAAAHWGADNSELWVGWRRRRNVAICMMHCTAPITETTSSQSICFGSVFLPLSLELNAIEQITVSWKTTLHTRMLVEDVWSRRLPAGSTFTRRFISSFLRLLCCRPLYLSLRLSLLQSSWFVASFIAAGKMSCLTLIEEVQTDLN